MQIYHWLLLALALYIVFFFAPGIVIFFTVFKRRETKPLPKQNLSKSYLRPYAKPLLAAYAAIEQQPLREVRLVASDGIPLAAEYLDCPSGKLAILLHGYRSSPLNGCCVMGAALRQRGFRLLMPYQRAHDKSGGSHSGLGLLEWEDLLCWLKWAEKQPGVEEILLYGVSMGCTTVAYASDRITSPKVKGMILDCGYTSVYDELAADCKKRCLPPALILPATRLTAALVLHRDISAKVTDHLSKTKIPALFFHGCDDTTVPASQGEKNYSACASPKEMLLVLKAPHTLAYLVGGGETEQSLDSFLQKYFI